MAHAEAVFLALLVSSCFKAARVKEEDVKQGTVLTLLLALLQAHLFSI